jgi:hypothetical protein
MTGFARYLSQTSGYIENINCRFHSSTKRNEQKSIKGLKLLRTRIQSRQIAR